MKIDDDGVGLLAKRTGRNLALDRREGIVELLHEDAAHGVDDEDAHAIPRHVEAGAAARRASREVDRPQEPVLPLGEGQRFALVEGMVAGRHDVGASVEHRAQDLLGDAEAAGGVLAVDDDEIEMVVGDKRRQTRNRSVPAAPPDEIAKEQQTQRLCLSFQRRKSSVSFSVTIQSIRTSCGSAGIAGTSCVAKARPTRSGLSPVGVEPRNCTIVETAAIPEARSSAVERDHGQDHKVRIGDLGIG